MFNGELSIQRLSMALALATLSLASAGWAGDSGSQAASGNPDSQTADATSGPTAPTMPAVLVTVNRFGVYPTEITRPAGQFMLVIRNSRGTRQENFSIVSESAGVSAKASPVAAMATTAANPKAMSVLNLPSGSYVLKFGNETEFSVKVTIQ